MAILGGLSILLFFIFLFLSIVALVKRNGKFKSRIIITGVFMVIAGLLGSKAGDSTTSKDAIAQSAPSKKEVKPVDVQTQKEKFAAFEKDLLDLSNLMLENEKKFIEFEKDFIQNPVPSTDAFAYAKNYKEYLENYTSVLMSARVPQELPDDVKDLLHKAISDYSSALSFKSKALDGVIKYMDSKKVSDLSTFKENKDFYLPSLKSGTEKMIQAKKIMDSKE
jgi:hypothetical protein